MGVAIDSRTNGVVSGIVLDSKATTEGVVVELKRSGLAVGLHCDVEFAVKEGATAGLLRKRGLCAFAQLNASTRITLRLTLKIQRPVQFAKSLIRIMG